MDTRRLTPICNARLTVRSWNRSFSLYKFADGLAWCQHGQPRLPALTCYDCSGEDSAMLRLQAHPRDRDAVVTRLPSMLGGIVELPATDYGSDSDEDSPTRPARRIGV